MYVSMNFTFPLQPQYNTRIYYELSLSRCVKNHNFKLIVLFPYNTKIIYVYYFSTMGAHKL